jgi:fructose-specific PTS system IIA-like component
MHEAIRRHHRTVAGAVLDAEAHFTAMLGASASVLLRERALDVRDVCFELLRQVYGKGVALPERALKTDSVVVAQTLTPEQFLALDRRFLRGLVLVHAGTASHTVILARSFGIPTLTGVVDIAGAGFEGQEAMVDGELGLLVTPLTEPARRYYLAEQRRLAGRRARQLQLASRPATTSDGQRLEIGANIATAEEAAAAMAAGAEGIGLFRTEMLFLERDSPPSEEEQFEAYRKTLAAAGDRTVILRTLDIGGDKPLAYLRLPAEPNPFLGSRAVRIYREFELLFRTQIRAVIRASAHGRLKVMFPMITCLEEVRWVKQVIADEQAKCAAQGIPFDQAIAVGAMIEVPVAAFLLDALSRELDFFSIGSNDLLQSFTAADRTDPRLALLCDPLQPAFLRLLKKIVDDAHAAGKCVGLCGEMGGQKESLPLLVGLGLDEISAALSVLPALKAELANWAAASCRELAWRALSCATADEVRRLNEEYAAKCRRPLDLVDTEMVVINSESASKEEAIKEAVDLLYVLGRTEQPRAVEEAVWQREAADSTGFGHGFAIPHCKSNAVAANSLAVLKLRAPVPWGSAGSEPVRVVIPLAVRDSDEANAHLKVFAQLARKLMHEEFRERLLRENDPARLCCFLKESLNLHTT